MTAPVLPCSALGDAVSRLRESVAEVMELQATGGDCSPVTLAVVLRLQEQAQGIVLRQVAQVEAAGTYQELGLQGTHQVISKTLGCTDGQAKKLVKLSHRLETDLEPVGDLLREGRISRDHASAVEFGVRGLDADIVTDCLDQICLAALNCDPPRLRGLLRERAEAICEDLAAEQRRKLDARVHLTLDETPGGGWLVNGLMGPEDGALLNDMLDKRAASDRNAGNRTGGDSNGDGIGGAQIDDRSNARRRHDAFLDVIRHYADCKNTDSDDQLPGQGSNRAQIVIVASADAVAGTPMALPAKVSGTEQGLLTRTALLRLMCDADISTMTLSDDLERVDLSRQTRTVSKGQWRMLTVRDRGCVVKGCRRRPSQCQAHHAIWWRNGGASDLENYLLLCHAHHHAVHDQGAWLTLDDSRTLTSAGYLCEPVFG